MSWPTFWTALLTSLGSSAACVAALAWLGKKWLGSRIENSVRHEYDKRLEAYKAELSQALAAEVRRIDRADQEAADRKAADRTLFRKFVSELPSDPVIEYVRDNDYGGPFRVEHHRRLDNFAHEWRNRERAFFDPALESARLNLLNSIDAFLAFVPMNTWTIDAACTLASVPSEWRHQKPELFNATVNRIHELATKIGESHGELIRLARERLHVPALTSESS